MRRRNAWVRACPACGFLASDLEPGGGTGIEGLEDLRRQNYQVILDSLERLRPLRGQRLLEVGSAWGWFLEAAAERGVVGHGIEPEAANVTLSRARGLSVEHGLFPQDLEERGPYDLIVFNDVFEHLPDPVTAIRAVEELLAPDGMVAINLPSSGGVMFRVASLLERLGRPGLYERLWQKGFPSPHVTYFSPRNLEWLAHRHARLARVDGFRLPSVSRHGLRAPTEGTHRGAAGTVLFAGLWVASFVLGWLPSDIEVVVFRKTAPAV